jgi:ABC-2 type transport system permease protein
MTGALLYLRLTSLRNLVLHRIRRLRQPKYVLGTAVAIAYFYFVVGRRVGTAWAASGAAMAAQGSGGVSSFATLSICVLLSAVGMLRLAYAWISPTETPGFRFSEAEIAFLFPAPITRKTLIHYRLLSAQIAILFTSLLIALVFNRAGYMGAHRVLRAIGWWVILATFDLHLNGTNLTLLRLRERGSRYVLWRIAAVSAIILYGVAIFWSTYKIAGGVASVGDFSSGALDQAADMLAKSPLFHAITLPFGVLFGPYVATSARAFALAMIPALVLLALNYYWVLNTEANFEEGSIAIAEKRAAARAAALRGEAPRIGKAKPKARSGPFPLEPVGPAEVAFLWKNLLSMRSSIFSRRSLFIIVGIAAGLSASLGPRLSGHGAAEGGDVVRHMVVVLCAMVAGYTILLGPQIARQDLRSDLSNIDLLKTYPIEGWRLALGELLAPTAILSVILWCAIAAASAAIDPGGDLEWLTPGVRLTLSGCLAFAAPLLCLIQLIVPNSMMLLLPGWYQSTRTRSGGIEMFGQRLIFGVVQIIFALLVAVPAAGMAALVFFSSKWAFGISPAAVLSTLAVLPMLGGEVAVGLWFLGNRFESFDLTAESR